MMPKHTANYECSWHSEKKLQTVLIELHEKYASLPKEHISNAQNDLDEVLDLISKEFRQVSIDVQLEYIGSSCEDIKIPSKCYEFDVMAILKCEKEVTVEEVKPLFVYLKSSSNDEHFKRMFYMNTQYLMPQKAAAYFESQLQRIISMNVNLTDCIKVKLNGASVVLDVNKIGLGYSVDIVPTFNIGSIYYVAKSISEEYDDDSYCGNMMSWTCSHSLEEKAEMMAIDSEFGLDQCYKQCIRILKVMIDKEPTLSSLTPYIIKTAVLTLNRPHNLNWAKTNIGCRFIDILWYLSTAVNQGNLHHYYEPWVNLLKRWDSFERKKVSFHLNELIRLESCFFQVIETISVQLAQDRALRLDAALAVVQAAAPAAPAATTTANTTVTNPSISAPTDDANSFTVIKVLFGAVALIGATLVKTYISKSFDKKNKDKYEK